VNGEKHYSGCLFYKRNTFSKKGGDGARSEVEEKANLVTDEKGRGV